MVKISMPDAISMEAWVCRRECSVTCGRPILSMASPHAFEIGSGRCGPPSIAARTNPSSGERPRPSAMRCSCWAAQCARSSVTIEGGSEIVRRPCLGVFGPNDAVRLLKRWLDRQPPRLQIDVAPPQAKRFIAPHAGRQSQRGKHEQAMSLQAIEQVAHLARLKDRNFSLRDGR